MVNQRLQQLLLLSFALFLALGAPIASGAEQVGIRHVLAIALVSFMSVVLGEGIRLALRHSAIFSLDDSAGIVLGFSALGIIHLTATVGLRLGAGTALWVDAGACACAGFWVYRQLVCKQEAERSTPTWTDIQYLCLALVALGFLVLLWGREAIGAVAETKQTGVFRVWNDFLLQAAEIGNQINYPAFRDESVYLAGQSQVFYHRASYSHAALVGWITGDPLIGLATYYWLPAGILMMGLGAYSLGNTLGGRFTGVVSALALLLLPDASMYGLKNGYFAFYWLIHVAPGSGYAIGLCLVALAFFFAGQQREGDARYLLVALAVALTGAVFRMHVAIPVVVFLAALLVFRMRLHAQVSQPVFFAAIATLGFCVMLIFETIAMAPHFISGKTHGLFYVEAVHLASPTAYEGVFRDLSRSWGSWTKGAVGYGLLLIAQHGLILPLLLFFLWKSPDVARRHQMAQVAIGLLLIHAVITFLVPTPANGDITEWSHRSFVVIHASLTILLIAAFAKALSANTELLTGLQLNHKGYIGAAVAATALLWVPWHFGKNLQYGTLKDGPSACKTKITAESFEVTQYIRQKSQATDLFFASNADPDAVLTALTGLQAYVSRGAFFVRLGGVTKAAVVGRMAEFDALKNAATWDAMTAFGEKSGVRWLVVESKDWPELNRALMAKTVLLNSQFALFDLKINTMKSEK